MVVIPRSVSEAIESVWTSRTENSQAVKYLWLTNWDLLRQTHPEQMNVILPFATENPIEYMQALTNGYTIEFDKELYFSVGDIELCFSEAILDKDYTTNTPINLCISDNTQPLSIEDAKSLSDNILSLIQELDKVRSEI